MPKALTIEMGIGWKPDPQKPGYLVTADIRDYVAEIERLRAALAVAREYVVRIDGTMAFTPPEKRVTRPDLDMIDAALVGRT